MARAERFFAFVIFNNQIYNLIFGIFYHFSPVTYEKASPARAKSNQPAYILVAADITTLKGREAELSQTISYTKRLLENLAAGNLTADDTTNLMGAAKRIQLRYNTTIVALGDLVDKIRQIAEQVKHASHELASGQRDLAQRIEQEAASLQEIAASLEEITTSTTETSKNARESTDFAQK